MNVLITPGTDGSVTVHKDTCKKIEGQETLSLEEQIALDPRKIIIANKASCCRPATSTLEDVEQAAWDALEAATAAEAEDQPAEATEVDTPEDLLGEVEVPEPIKKVAKKAVAAKVAKDLAAAKEVNGADALKKVAAHLGVDLGKNPTFPGFGRAFKTANKQSIYINSKGSADARASSPAEATEWAALDHVERRAGNYVRVSFGNL